VTSVALAALLEKLKGQKRNDPHDERVRLAVQLRARNACEYCLMPTTGQFHIDHIIPSSRWENYVSGRTPEIPTEESRRGPDHLDNFAWACPFCNVVKGQEVARRVGQRAHRLFDPRRDRWEEHFVFLHTYLFIIGVSNIGEATEHILRLNDARTHGPLGTRHDAILVGRYPPDWARSWRASTDA
jgi:5-methylcytosine-specific restriction endonuclease McrA